MQQPEKKERNKLNEREQIHEVKRKRSRVQIKFWY